MTIVKRHAYLLLTHQYIHAFETLVHTIDDGNNDSIDESAPIAICFQEAIRS